MKALMFNGPWQLDVVDHPDPEPGDGEVLIETLATGICGSDIHGYSGETGRRHPGQVMGHETVGRVLNVGAGVDAITPGITVTINPILGCGRCGVCKEGASNVCPDHRIIGVDPKIDGTFAERFVVPAPNVIPMADGVPVLHGALVEPLAVGYHAVRRGGVATGDRVLVIGGGPIGQAAALASRREGAGAILVSEVHEGRRRLLDALGFHAVPPEDLITATDEILGRPATKVIDAVGVNASLIDSFEHSHRQAVIVLVGMGSKSFEIPAYPVSVGERSIVGSYCYSDAHFRETAEWVSSGQPELDLLLDDPAPLSEGPEAFRRLARGADLPNKVVLLPDDVQVGASA